MSYSNNDHTLRKVSAFLYLATFIATIIVLSTVSAVCPPQTSQHQPSSSPRPTNTTTQTFPINSHYASDIFPIVASTLASAFALFATIKVFFFPNTNFHLTTTLLSTACTVFMITIAYLRRRSALLPCTAGDTGTNPYVSSCQLRQAVCWNAVVSAVAFVGCAGVVGLLYRTAKRERNVVDADGHAGDAVGMGSGKDVEGEVEWSERVGRFDIR
jgi:hypothetical protein